MENKSRSLVALASDAQFNDNELFATVEFKSRESSTVGYWIVSGLDGSDLPVMIASLSIGMLATNDKEALVEAEIFVRTSLFPFIRSLGSTNGLVTRVPPLSGERRNSILLEHLAFHSRQPWVKSLTRQLQTESYFRMATYLEATAPQKLIAAHQGVKTSTINDQLKIAKAKGRLPKTSSKLPKNSERAQ